MNIKISFSILIALITLSIGMGGCSNQSKKSSDQLDAQQSDSEKTVPSKDQTDLSKDQTDLAKDSKASAPEAPNYFLKENGANYFYTKNLFNLTEKDLSPFLQRQNEFIDWQITHFISGYLDREGENLRFYTQSEFAMKPGRLYGWAMRFKRVKKSTSKILKISEVLTLPQTPQRLLYDTSTTEVDKNGKKIESKLKAHPDETWIYHFWEMTEDDPKGTYQLQVVVENQVLKNLTFNVN